MTPHDHFRAATAAWICTALVAALAIAIAEIGPRIDALRGGAALLSDVRGRL